MRGRYVVLENISEPSQEGFDRVTPEGVEVPRGFEEGGLHDVRKIESALQSLVQQTLGDHIEVGAKSIEQFPFGGLVPLLGLFQYLLRVEEHKTR